MPCAFWSGACGLCAPGVTGPEYLLPKGCLCPVSLVSMVLSVLIAVDGVALVASTLLPK